ncbi:MAG TPA: hypothetical protein VMG38_00800 [Trebonia sp.]|nr:hypothetical protein [Trebonia sp.]
MKGIWMRIRSRTGHRLTGVVLAGSCCAALAACTAATSTGPINSVTRPAVGRPTPPDSVDAALARMALYPYAILGQSDNDPLAPGESDTELGTKCMAEAGYPGAQSSLGIQVRASTAGLGFGQDYGAWGYVGATDARQSGFRPTAGRALNELGIGQGNSPASLSAAEQDAVNKCDTIKFNFLNDMFNGPLAGINAIANTVGTDLANDPSVKNATRAWSRCMARNGYNYASPQAAAKAELASMFGGNGSQINVSGQVSPSVNAAQIAAAISDANCTTSADLAGIYFAVEASYDQQIVAANQTALASGVQRYRSAYATQISDLPHLLATTKANAFPAGPKQPAPGKSSTCKGGPSSESAC